MNSPAVRDQPDLAARQHAPRGRVLVVDDEEPNRLLLRDPLEARGYAVEEATHGEEALRVAAARPPDVILLDLMMPVLDGFQTCRRLKSQPVTAPIPVLMVTALSERQERLLAIQAGANDYLTKPVDLQDLILRVGNAVQVKRLYDQVQAERERSEQLLRNILPAPVAERMKRGETPIADAVPEAGVLLADLVGFTRLASTVGADHVVELLNEVFTAFDLLVERSGLEKIKTIGDAYLAAAGVPLPHPQPARAVATLALALRAETQRINENYGTSFRLRIGLSVGPLVAGVIGRNKFAYDIWGETVNVACRLCGAARPGEILLPAETAWRLEERFEVGASRPVELKGLGLLQVRPLHGQRGSS